MVSANEMSGDKRKSEKQLSNVRRKRGNRSPLPQGVEIQALYNKLLNFLPP
jgi:hypothetical protein